MICTKSCLEERHLNGKATTKIDKAKVLPPLSASLVLGGVYCFSCTLQCRVVLQHIVTRIRTELHTVVSAVVLTNATPYDFRVRNLLCYMIVVRGRRGTVNAPHPMDDARNIEEHAPARAVPLHPTPP